MVGKVLVSINFLIGLLCISYVVSSSCEMRGWFIFYLGFGTASVTKPFFPSLLIFYLFGCGSSFLLASCLIVPVLSRAPKLA